jgi:hypothetical protein
MPWICWVRSSMPGGREDFHAGWGAATSISISLSSSSPSRSFLRNFCRVRIPPRCGVRLPAPARRRQQHVEHAVLGGIHRRGRAPCAWPPRGLLDRDLGQVADDGVDVAADIAHLGELGRLDLDEGRVGQPRQAPRDLGLADAGGADHQDVLGRDLGAQRLGHLHAAPAVAQGDGHGALGARLADDVLVEFGTISWGVIWVIDMKRPVRAAPTRAQRET